MQQGKYNWTATRPCWKIDSFMPEVLVCWRCTEKITIKIERAVSVILRASPATRCSFQQLLQCPAVAVTSGNSHIRFPEVVSKCQTRKLFPSHRRSSPVTAWDNYIIIATFEGLKQPLGLKQLLLVSGEAPTSSVFSKLFQVVQIVSNCYYVRPAASLLPNDYYLFDKQSW